MLVWTVENRSCGYEETERMQLQPCPPCELPVCKILCEAGMHLYWIDRLYHTFITFIYIIKPH